MHRHYARPVTIASVCGPNNDTQAFLDLTHEAAMQHPDMVVLPEDWQHGPAEALDSPVITRLRQWAREGNTYILHPTILQDGAGREYTSALLIDRRGEIAGEYHKIYPYWGEFPQITPGAMRQPVIECDFGKIGILICFDANFPQIWADLAEQGAELVIWPSAYMAGRQLEAHALNHHFYIVTSTLHSSCMAIDIDGRRVLDVQGTGHHTQWVTLDLDRCVFHENFNHAKLDSLLAESPRRIEIERHWPEEQWIIVRAAREGVSARQVCREAGMEELRDYKRRSRISIDDMRP